MNHFYIHLTQKIVMNRWGPLCHWGQLIERSYVLQSVKCDDSLVESVWVEDPVLNHQPTEASMNHQPLWRKTIVRMSKV